MKTFLVTKTGAEDKPWMRVVDAEGGDIQFVWPRKMDGTKGTGLPKLSSKDGAKFVTGVLARNAAHKGKDGKDYPESHVLFVPGY